MSGVAWRVVRAQAVRFEFQREVLKEQLAATRRAGESE
jgi:hypothetical protein